MLNFILFYGYNFCIIPKTLRETDRRLLSTNPDAAGTSRDYMILMLQGSERDKQCRNISHIKEGRTANVRTAKMPSMMV